MSAHGNRYLEYNQSEFRSYLGTKGFELRDSQDQWTIKVCPFCPPTKGKSDNEYKLYVRKDTGAFRCNRCSATGSHADLRRDLGDLDDALERQNGPSFKRRNFVKADPERLKRAQSWLDGNTVVVEWLASRGITEAGAKAYRLGAEVKQFGDLLHNCVTFGWYDTDQDGREIAVRTKLRSVHDKKCMTLEPKGGGYSFFGWHLVTEDTQEVVLTEGELDAITVHQETGMVAISLPNGTDSLMPDLVKKLERFRRIFLWLDDDKAGREALDKHIPKIGLDRSYVIQTRGGTSVGPKDANDALLAGLSIKSLVASAKLRPHKEIVTPAKYREKVKDRLLNPDKYLGLPIPGFERLTKLLGGHRPTEITLVTGPTGFGKTTTVRQMVLNLCMEYQLPTLLCSFEIVNDVLLTDVARQLGGDGDLTKEGNADKVLDFIEALPIELTTFWGSTNVDEVIDACTYAVRVQGVRQIMIDNLQFMLSVQAKGSNKFDVQDEAIHKLRVFVNQLGVHLWLISHPKKWGFGASMDLSAVFGSGKATQDVDNVLLLQPGGDDGDNYIEVQKNRYLGRKGKVFYRFDEKTRSIEETELTEGAPVATKKQSRTYRSRWPKGHLSGQDMAAGADKE